jgi:two-component system chemotaxis sensor kinase CheA
MSIRERSLQVFREEATDHLDDLESALLALEESPDSAELVQGVFRTVHTLKGSSAMFGFDNLARLAHMLEDVFDLVRKGRMNPEPGFLEAAFISKDVMSAMVGAMDDTSGDLRDRAENLITELKKFLPKAGEEVPPHTDSPAPPLTGPGEAGGAGGMRTYRIGFRPEQGVFRRGINILGILEDLRALGECSVNVLTDDLPMLEDMVALDCYLAWDIVLSTDKREDAIRDAFMFVEDASEISISIIKDAPGSHAKEGPVESPEKRPGSNASASATSVRVPSEKLDSMVDLVGELVTVQARLKEAASVDEESEFYYISEDVERLTNALRDNAMGLRMIPISATFNRFKRLVRDLSVELGKEVELITGGGETELDKHVIERLNDPLTHILRNSIGHGIESPAERKAGGKSSRGMVYLSAEHSGGNVHIRIVDDGNGIDTEKVRTRAIEKGLVAEKQELTETEAYRLIFAPGFSTAETVSNVSGRGVGMDVVKKNIEALRGSIGIESEKGKGTTITLKIPLTLAIIDGLLVRIGEGDYVIPLTNVEECVEIRVEDLDDDVTGLAEVRGTLVPYVNLRKKFDIRGGVPPISQIVVTEGSGRRAGVLVDEVIGEIQTVIKSLGTMYRGVEGISGGTILGNGTVALILDVNQLFSESSKKELSLT